MNRILQLPVIRWLHERRLLFPAVLGLAVAGVLVDGAIHRGSEPRNPPQLDFALPPITVPSLRPALEKSPLTYHADYWWQLAEITRKKIILLGPGNRSAVMVAPGVALTGMEAVSEIEAEFHPAANSSDVISVAENPVVMTPPYRLLGLDPEEGVSLFAVKQPEGVQNFSEAEIASLRPGSYVVAVSLTSGGDVQVVPGYVTQVHLPSAGNSSMIDFALPFPESCEAAAVVDLDGRLAGVAIRTDGGMNIMPADAVGPLVDRLAASAACLAIEAGDLEETARELLGVQSGVVIQRVIESAFEPEPSLREGDILLTWDREPVDSAEEFAGLYFSAEPGKLIRYTVIRNQRRISGATRMPGPDCRPADPGLRLYPGLGVSVEWKEDGWKVIRVLDNSPAEAAGLSVGDAIIGAGGIFFKEKDAEPFEAFDKEPRPMALTVRRHERVRIIVVTPAET